MIKKIVVGLLAVIILICLLLIAYLFSISVDRPTDNLEPISVVHDQQYHENAIKAEQWLASVYETNLFPSFSVSIGIQGKLVWEGIIGHADINNRRVADQNTRYKIGSISKPITATALMRMQEKQLLALDDNFLSHVRDYPTENSGFTLKHLLTHQSGVRHYIDELSENLSNTEYPSTREAAAIVQNDALLFSPGQGFHYSTYGYTLLSLAMESAYAQPFERIMYEEVFKPAGMTATQFDKAGTKTTTDIATPYLNVGTSLFESPDVNASNKYAGGGYLSTPSDLVRFAHALLNNSLITVESTEVMWTPVALSNGEMNPENYALGFRVGQDDVGRFVHHGGKSVGGYSFLLIYPDLDLVVAFSTNVTPSENSFDRLQQAQKIARLFIN